jgi:hypothetical protein
MPNHTVLPDLQKLDLIYLATEAARALQANTCPACTRGRTIPPRFSHTLCLKPTDDPELRE